MSVLAATDFAQLLGIESTELGPQALRLIDSCDFSYATADFSARDTILLEIIRKIDSGAFSVSGASRREDWEKGWNENLQEFTASGYRLESLVPRYFKPDQPRRLAGQFIFPAHPDFELNFIRVVRAWLASQYLSKFRHIFEFGCGTGYHLVDLAGNCPDSIIHAFDWVQASAKTFALIAEHFKLNIEAGVFNFFEPDEQLEVPPHSVCFTFAALEQAGQNYKHFLEFILRKRFELCVHVECMDEFYDQNVLPDYLGARYHNQRNYLKGFHGSIRALEQEGRARMLKARRTTVGNMFHEAYSVLIWKPA